MKVLPVTLNSDNFIHSCPLWSDEQSGNFFTHIWNNCQVGASSLLEFRAQYLRLSDASLFLRLITGISKLKFQQYAYPLKSTSVITKFCKGLNNMGRNEGEWTFSFTNLQRNADEWRKVLKVVFNYLKLVNYLENILDNNYLMKWGFHAAGWGWDYSLFKNGQMKPVHIWMQNVTPVLGPMKFVLKGINLGKAIYAWCEASDENVVERRVVLFRASINFTGESIRMTTLLAKKILERSYPQVIPYLEVAPTCLGVISSGVGLWLHYKYRQILPPQPIEEVRSPSPEPSDQPLSVNQT